jgi:hypothetical protein
MNEFDFTLKFALPDTNVDLDEYAARLYESGCDDALIGIGKPGKIALDFGREAETAIAAVTSAILDVNRCIPEARLIECSPDYVGISDIAVIVGYTRQNIRKLMISHFGDFPPPLHDGSTQIWRLLPVLDWFGNTRNLDIDPVLKEIARANMGVNFSVREQPQIDPDLTDDIRTAFG